MSASRSPFRYSNPGKFLDGIPLNVYDQLYGWNGFAFNFTNSMWPGPLSTTTDAGIVEASATGTETITFTSKKLRLAVQATANGNVQLEFPVRHHYIVGKRMRALVEFAISDVDEMLIFMGWATPSDSDVFNTFPTEGIFV